VKKYTGKVSRPNRLLYYPKWQKRTFN